MSENKEIKREKTKNKKTQKNTGQSARHRVY